MPYIKIASQQDAKELSKNLRKEDLDEIKANANANPYHALVSGVKYSHLPLECMWTHWFRVPHAPSTGEAGKDQSVQHSL